MESPLVRQWNNFHMMERESNRIIHHKRTDIKKHLGVLAMVWVGSELDGERHMQ